MSWNLTDWILKLWFNTNQSLFQTSDLIFRGSASVRSVCWLGPRTFPYALLTFRSTLFLVSPWKRPDGTSRVPWRDPDKIRRWDKTAWISFMGRTKEEGRRKNFYFHIFWVCAEWEDAWMTELSESRRTAGRFSVLLLSGPPLLETPGWDAAIKRLDDHDAFLSGKVAWRVSANQRRSATGTRRLSKTRSIQRSDAVLIR